MIISVWMGVLLLIGSSGELITAADPQIYKTKEECEATYLPLKERNTANPNVLGQFYTCIKADVEMKDLGEKKIKPNKEKDSK